MKTPSAHKITPRDFEEDRIVSAFYQRGKVVARAVDNQEDIQCALAQHDGRVSSKDTTDVDSH